MYPSPKTQRFLVRLHKVVSKTNTDLPGKKGLLEFLESVEFSAEKLYEKYNVPEIDRGIVERSLEYLSRNRTSTQHRRREINALDMSEYEKAVYNAINNGATKDDLMITLNFALKEDLYNSIKHQELKSIVMEMQ